MKNLFSRINTHTIRFRLLSVAILLVLLTALSISTGTLLMGLQNSRTQAVTRLYSIIKIKELEIQSWKDQLQGELYTTLNEEYALERISSILGLEEKNRYSQYFNGAVRARLNGYVLNSSMIHEIFILNKGGEIILSTDKENEGISAENARYFREGLQDSTLELIVDNKLQDVHEAVISVPIFNLDGELAGVLAAKAEISSLADILADSSGMGMSGNSFLTTPDDQYIFSVGEDSVVLMRINADLPSQFPETENGYLIYQGINGAKVVGVQQQVSELNLSLILQQELQEIYENARNTLLLNLMIVLVVLLIAVFVSLIMIQRISRPLDNLVKTTSLIAGGDLSQTASIEQDDEIGSLAVSFNSMTAQLAGLINSLEQKVESRTLALKQRALQLETILQVSQEITSVLNIEELLNRIVRVIQESFYYSDVFIYLLDEENQYLNLQAASSENKSILNKIKADSSNYISRAAQTQTPQLLDFNNQSGLSVQSSDNLKILSELAVPLDYGGEPIGALVVQSSHMEPSLQDDIPVLQTLADQLTIAIENARLYKKSQQIAVLEERNRLAQDLHDSVTQSLYSLGLFIESWRMILKSGKEQDFSEFLNRSEEINQQALKEMRQLIHELRPPVLEKLGLWGALIQRLEMVEKRLGIDAYLEIQDFIELPLDLENVLFRITQEALNNALKHAQARRVIIRVKHQDGLLSLEVVDDGTGFDLQKIGQSDKMGLQIMQERAFSIHANLLLKSSPGEGTTVLLEIPLGKNEGFSKERVSE